MTFLALFAMILAILLLFSMAPVIGLIVVFIPAKYWPLWLVSATIYVAAIAGLLDFALHRLA